jgi:hypothetical protein
MHPDWWRVEKLNAAVRAAGFEGSLRWVGMSGLLGDVDMWPAMTEVAIDSPKASAGGRQRKPSTMCGTRTPAPTTSFG